MAQFKSIKSNRYVSLRKFDRWSLFWPVSIQSETNRTTRWRQANQVANEAFSGSVATLLIRRLINSEKMVSHRHATTRQMSSKVKLSASCWIRSILFFNKIRKKPWFFQRKSRKLARRHFCSVPAGRTFCVSLFRSADLFHSIDSLHSFKWPTPSIGRFRFLWKFLWKI